MWVDPEPEWPFSRKEYLECSLAHSASSGTVLTEAGGTWDSSVTDGGREI